MGYKKAILKSINVKDQKRKKFINTKNKNLRIQRELEYKTYKNLLTKILRTSKTNYYKNYFQENRANLRLVWKAVREVTDKKQKSEFFPKIIHDENGIEVKDQNTIVNIFNNFYGSIAEKTKQKIVNTNHTFHEYLQNPTRNSIYIAPTTTAEIGKIINSLNEAKASGPNSIPVNFLKIINPTFSEIFSKLINECLELGIYPDCVKIASIKPLHKKNSKFEPGNYRPISLLSNIGKIFEKILHDRLTNFLEHNNIFFKNQFGFRKKHNTTHAIIALTEKIRNCLDKNEFAVGVFVDLQKAFDTVDHNILINKLSHYGIRGKELQIFQSYLTNRTHYVEHDGVKSLEVEIKHGVPQGSVLGPLLFLIYINDLNKAIKHSHTFHFADDTSLLCHNTQLKELNKNVNEDLTHLVHWLRANKISLNASKTELVIFKKQNQGFTKHLNFRLSGQKLTPTKTTEYLGIILDENLNWDHHLSRLRTKLSNAVGILSKLRYYLDFTTLRSVYFALFESHLNYCLPCLGHTKVEQINQLASLQNKAIRIINFKKITDPVKPLFVNSRILPISKLRKYKNCFFAFDHMKGSTPSYFANYFERMGNNHDHFTKAHLKLKVHRTNTVKYGTYSVTSSVVKDWNELIGKIVTNSEYISRTTFKKHLFSLLLEITASV